MKYTQLLKCPVFEGDSWVKFIFKCGKLNVMASGGERANERKWLKPPTFTAKLTYLKIVCRFRRRRAWGIFQNRREVEVVVLRHRHSHHHIRAHH